MDGEKGARRFSAWHGGLEGLAVHVDRDVDAARSELVASARTFSARASDVVDDKLALSVTLMRAGEVDEAHRLLFEVEREVRSERDVLVRRIDEARTVRRRAVTRMRLARTLAVAMLGASALSLSAVGWAVAAMFSDRDAVSEREESRQRVRAQARNGGDNPRMRSTVGPRRTPGGGGNLHRVVIGDMRIMLTTSEMRVYTGLLADGADPQSLTSFLTSVVPPSLAGTLQEALTTVASTPEAAPTVAVEDVERHVEEGAKHAEESSPEAPADEETERAEKKRSRPRSSADDGNRRSGGRNGEGGGSNSGIPPLPEPQGESAPLS